MSADNGMVIRNHPNGGYALVHYYMSSDTYPEASPTATQYASIEEAENAYDHMVLHEDLITEYGLSILLDAPTDPMTSEAYHKRMESATSGVSSEKPTTAESLEKVVCNCYTPRTNIHFEDCAVIRAAMAESHWYPKLV